MEEVPEETDEMLMDEEVWKTVELSTGRTAVIKDGTVAQHNRALRHARNYGGDGVSQEQYLMALFSELVEIDGQTFSLDEVEKLPLREYFPVQAQLDELAESPTSAGEGS